MGQRLHPPALVRCICEVGHQHIDLASLVSLNPYLNKLYHAHWEALARQKYWQIRINFTTLPLYNYNLE